VVATGELVRALERDHVARLLDHADQLRVATTVLADPAPRVDREVEADLAAPDGLLDLADRLGEPERLVVGRAQKVEGQTLGRALSDARQARELGDEAVDRGASMRPDRA
jgi:hypothetical protein